MARIRTIKPEFWTSDQIVGLSIKARLLFIAMWNFADDSGNMPASAKSLKMKALPGDEDVSSAMVNDMVDEMIEANLVIAYTVNDADYWHISGFKKHQKVDRPSNKYPQFGEHSANIRRTPPPGVECKGRECKGEEGKVKEGSVVEAAPTPFFEENELSDHDMILKKIKEWGAPHSFEELKTLAKKADYNPELYGPVKDEVSAFVSHYLGTEKAEKLKADPVGFLRNILPLWLKNAKKWNKPQKPDKPKAAAWQRPTVERAKDLARGRFGGLAEELSDQSIKKCIEYAKDSDGFYNLIANEVNRNKQKFARTGLVSLSDSTAFA